MRFAGQRAPAPLRVGDLPDGGSYIVMELLDLKPFALLDRDAQHLLGRALARMHMHQPDRHAFFGFGVETKAGECVCLSVCLSICLSGWLVGPSARTLPFPSSSLSFSPSLVSIFPDNDEIFPAPSLAISQTD
jgi:hypothetical protein